MDANWKTNPVIVVCSIVGTVAVAVTAIPKIWRAAVSCAQFIDAVDKLGPVLGKIVEMKGAIDHAAADSRLAITLIEEVKSEVGSIKA